MQRKLKAEFGLKFNPFSPDVPTEALSSTAQAEEFGWRIEHSLASEGGFAMITGEPGMGKSVALRLLAGRLGRLREVEVGCLEHPQSGLADFYREMGDLFGVELRPHNRWAGFRVLREKWISHIGNTMMRPVLLVDEAQEVNTAVLNELRILSSTCFDSRSLLGVVLAGDQRLVARLRHQDLAPLKSRIRMQLVLESATPKELEACLLQLVEAAGNQALLTPGLARTIRVKSHPYSVPSRLIGERVRVRVFEEYLEIYLSGDLMARRGRVRGNGAFNVSWRDVIGGLVRKPGAFRRYLYRDAVFPSDLFRRAYERLDTALPTWVADMNYLQVVKLARDTTQHDVERALGALEETQELPHFEAVAALAGMERPTIPEVHVDEVEFAIYDELTPDAAKEAKQ